MDNHYKEAEEKNPNYNPVEELFECCKEIAHNLLETSRKQARLSGDVLISQLRQESLFQKHAKVAVSSAILKIKDLFTGLERPIKNIVNQMNEDILLKMEVAKNK